jgi:hypothetical protein
VTPGEGVQAARRAEAVDVVDDVDRVDDRQVHRFARLGLGEGLELVGQPHLAEGELGVVVKIPELVGYEHPSTVAIAVPASE